MENKKPAPQIQEDEPTIAPGISANDELEQQATRSEIEHGDSTTVTRLHLDRTPRD